MLPGSEKRNVQAQGNHRAEVRSNVFLAAALVVGGASLAVRVRNLSAQGALIDGGSLPPAGVRVRLLRGELSADGLIAWMAEGHAGIRFAGEIDVAAWVKRLGDPGQRRVDDAIAALRDHVPEDELPGDRPRSLRALSEELDAICERLAGATSMTLEVGEELVRLDALARTLQQLASR